MEDRVNNSEKVITKHEDKSEIQNKKTPESKLNELI